MADGASTRQLDFYQAMSDFKHMFPNMEEDVIEAVLRANNGAVDPTIEQLLTMNEDAGHSIANIDFQDTMVKDVQPQVF